MLPLFDDPGSAQAPGNLGAFDRVRLAQTLARLAGEGVYLGTSSWKYEGWLGQIYSHEKYMVRGRLSKARFEQNCITEYAATFPIVCGDFSFYQFPSVQFWQRLFSTAPPNLKFAFKVPEEVTVKVFPSHPRYGPRAGEVNQTFLHADLFEAAFLEPLSPYRARIPALIFEFGCFSRRAYAAPEEFAADLDHFLTRLPASWRYAVEVRNPGFLSCPEYFATLQRHGVAHVFNAWSRMPPLDRQIEITEAFTTDFSVVRGLLRAGRVYEEAVKKFQPYERIQDPNPQTRQAVRTLIARAKKKREPAYLFINNRLEGNAPATIDAIVHDHGMMEEIALP